jgi:hypothetical protein
MNHDRIKELIFALDDGGLDLRETEEIKNHLHLCIECREMTQGWNRMQPLLQRSRLTPDSSGFVRRVMARIHDLQDARPAWRTFLRTAIPVIGFAFAGLCLALGTPLIEPHVTTDCLLMGHSTTASFDIHEAVLGLDGR